MKIEYIKLRNFASISAAFKSSEIEIDFSQMKNKIILLTGPNGSGKTSILSTLHPFATNGSLDERSDIPIVQEGKEGYKEIHIRDGMDFFVIKHFYTPKEKTHSVKSFIEKNGNELNPNGNVTSFKTVVEEELDIEMEYLKLARLGSNVTGFIDLKSTDRKAFMGKLLEEIDIYMKYYKKLTGDLREVKSLISHTSDKISKLGIVDSEEFEKSQKALEKKIVDKKAILDSIEQKIAINSHELSSVLKDRSAYDIKEELLEKIKGFEKMSKAITKVLEKGLSTTDDDSEIKSLLEKEEKELYKLEAENETKLELRSHKIETLDGLMKDLDDVDKEIRDIENDSSIKNEEDIIDEIKKRIEKRAKEKQIVDFHPSYTKQEIEELLVLMKYYMDLMLTTYEFGRKPIEKAFEYIESKEDIAKYVANHQEKKMKNRMQEMSEYVVSEMKKTHKNVFPSCKDGSTCPVYEYYQDLMDYATEVPDAIIEDDAFVLYTKMAYQNITAFLNAIKEKKELCDKMPKSIKDMFLYPTLSGKIMTLSKIYDSDVFYRELSLVTEYELQQNDLKELKDHKEKLKLLKKSSGNMEYLEKRKETLLEDISSIKEDIHELTITIGNLQASSREKKELVDELHEFLDAIARRDDAKDEIDLLKEDMNKIMSLTEEKKTLFISRDQISFDYNKMVSEFGENNYRITSYKELSKDLKKYQKDFDDITLIKDALSSKEGIPLLFIEVYFKDIQEITNDLLEIIYENELYIEDFEITADEFGIPFVTKNHRIKDVRYASQGERSFISLALSFALIYKSISRYNIMLLDEIDSTLDTANREKFLTVLEKQVDMIDAEQIFLISHNNMFSMYPVDIVDTRNEIDDSLKLAHQIPIQKR